MQYLVKICVIFLCFFIGLQNNFAANGDIDFIVSPIKYEIDADPGDSITKTAKILNLSPDTAQIKTFSANFFSNNATGAPSFAKDGSIPNPNTEIASWITISENNFSVDSEKEKEVNFTINVPANATPGGHYGAVFFKYNGGANSGKVALDADYGVLILVRVSGDIVDSGAMGKIQTVSGSLGDIEHPSNNPNVTIIGKNFQTDNCEIDLTASDTDGKCIDKQEAQKYLESVKENIMDLEILHTIVDNTDSSDSTEEGKTDDKHVGETNIHQQESKHHNDNNTSSDLKFDIPFINDGNSHIKPKGKIILKDKNGNILTGIGTELVKDDLGNIVGEKIVDYIKINPGGGNVLPETKRVFSSEWTGFHDIKKGKDGKAYIINNSASNYFSKLHSTNRKDLYPWERICYKQETENITAIIDTSYENYEGEEIEFNSASEIQVKYKRSYVSYNPYFFILLTTILILLWFFWILLFRRKKKRCINKECRKKIDKKMKICPYCETKQDVPKKKKPKKEKKKKKKELSKEK